MGKAKDRYTKLPAGHTKSDKEVAVTVRYMYPSNGTTEGMANKTKGTKRSTPNRVGTKPPRVKAPYVNHGRGHNPFSNR